MQTTQFKHFSNIILASASPRRADLLRQIGLEFQICPSGVAEPEITHQPPTRAVQELALMKASAVAEGLDSGLVIGADTVVVIDEKVIGKPEQVSLAPTLPTNSALEPKIQHVVEVDI